MDLYPQVWVTYPRVLTVAKVIPASPGKIDMGLPAQGVWYLQFWGLPLATRRPPQWPRENCRRPLCPPPLCSPSPFSSSPKPLNNSALQSVLTNLAWPQVVDQNPNGDGTELSGHKTGQNIPLMGGHNTLLLWDTPFVNGQDM